MEWLQHYLITYGAIVLFVCLYFESFGAPLPGESTVIAASILASQGLMHLPTVLFAVFSGAVLGDLTGYLIGRTGGRRVLLRHGHWVKLTHARLEALEERFRRQGVYLVMISRFVVLLRQLNGLIAGSVNMPLHLFMFANVVGAAVWTLAWGYGSAMAAHWFEPLWAHIKAWW
ncbi:DedA family protein [Bordetella genomosp. 1]|uniref:DedA family protein n=1 Tax=Bordetella genomosp. 1 TaxID=1395607 RepID=A0A261RWK7_9BORD|nr:DedA family protein [Bordetella genomosp. 1]MDQ8033262.1 DedA family protein [Bordetella sp.]OZI29281.1 DedA family protein [Bordetella genomosp. 1]OZI64987.1 DedA family protein [Bordetella genomosp. 1]